MEKILKLKAEGVAIATSTRPPPSPPKLQHHIFLPTNQENIFERSRTHAYMDPCEEQIFREYEAETRASPQPPPSQLQEIQNNTLPRSPMEALQSSLTTGKFSDLTVIHTTKRWNAHKVIVCSQSPVLEARIEIHQGVSLIDLSTQDLVATTALMEYLYTSTYTTTEVAPTFSLPLHIKLFALSTTLSIPSLQVLTEANFRHILNNQVTNIDVYFAAVREIYATTDKNEQNPGLRRAVVEAAVTEMRTLLSDDENINEKKEREIVREKFLRLTSEVQDFQADIYEMLIALPLRPVEVVVQEMVLCENCGPREEGDGYEVETECKGCGEAMKLGFS